MASNVVGESGLIFGVSDKTYGYFENLEISEEISDAEVGDGDGDIVAFSHFGKRFNVSGSYIFRAKASSPDAIVGTGSSISIDQSSDSDCPINGENIYIKSARTTYQKEGFKQVDFEGTSYPSLVTS